MTDTIKHTDDEMAEREFAEVHAQLAECQNELALLARNTTAVVTAVQHERDDAVAALAKRSEELAACREKVREFGVYEWKDAQLKKALATCREELEVTRVELATALSEGDALKAERDKLRTGQNLCSKQYYVAKAEQDKLRQTCEIVRGNLPRDIPSATEHEMTSSLQSIRHIVGAALEPTTNSDGAVKEDKCPRADMEAKSCARDS